MANPSSDFSRGWSFAVKVTDVAIIGGGLAGSAAATILGRAGVDAVLIDPHRVYPVDFRCEKIGGWHLDAIRAAGLDDVVFGVTTFDGHGGIARYGHLLDVRPSDQHGAAYENLVNALRAAIPASVGFIEAKANDIETGDDRQTITLNTGETISARLIVLANGLNFGVRERMGLRREVLSENHSVTIGFNAVRVGHRSFPPRSLTYFPERASSLVSYLTLFPIRDAMRANLMVYRPVDDPWLSRMRHTPIEAIKELMPRLTRITGEFEVEGPVKIRPASLWQTQGYLRSGIALIGDAFQTSCPAAGTGAGRAFNDVARLCNEYIPCWLATPGMAAEKIAQFYADPVKQDRDRFSLHKAFFLRDLSINTSPVWTARRLVRFAGYKGIGILRALQRRGEPQQSLFDGERHLPMSAHRAAER